MFCAECRSFFLISSPVLRWNASFSCNWAGGLRAVRIHQGWTASQMAEKVGISRTTLASVEAGAASPAIGTYLKVVGVLGLASDLALVATSEGTAKG